MKSKENGKTNTDFYETTTVMPCRLKYISLVQKKVCQKIT